MLENTVRITVIGKDGYGKGVVIDDIISFKELDYLDNPKDKLMEMVNGMRKELGKYEINHNE